jgi:SAM-dependent methyltransferase
MSQIRATAMQVIRSVLRPLGVEISLVRGSLPPQPQATGIEYWRYGLERALPRWYEVTWHRRAVIRIPTHRNERAYWRRRDDLLELIEEMTAASILKPLRPDTKVFEPGCNVAQNLWELSRRWGCEVYGLDIDQGAIDKAAKRGWRRPARFFVGNVLDGGTFTAFADGHFDLVLTRWHLIHVPPGESKRRYLAELRRIGRSGLILEPFDSEKVGQVEWAAQGTYCLSWDDWAAWLRLKRYTPKVPLQHTDVFYW